MPWISIIREPILPSRFLLRQHLSPGLACLCKSHCLSWLPLWSMRTWRSWIQERLDHLIFK